jgi:thioredoxin reductase (NADPH)
MEQMQLQAEHVGTEIIYDMIANVDLSARPFKAVRDSGDIIMADTVVICTGAQARWLGLENEYKFRGFGVSACATCDGFFFKNQDIAVVGGGNSAVEEALFLTNFAKSVTLIHRKDTLRAEKIAQDRLLNNPKVKVIWNHKVADILGNPVGGDNAGVTGLLLEDVNSGAQQTLPVTGVFIAIGHDPATSLFKGQVNMDDAGYIITAPDSTTTSVAGVFAAGDVKDKIYRQAITAAGMGCMAALEADKFLAEQGGH